MLYRIKGNLRFLHLAFHKETVDVPPLPVFHWVEVRHYARWSPQVATKCQLVASRAAQGQVPYGYGQGKAFFNLTGDPKLNGDAGMTCATFITAIYASLRLAIVIGPWPKITDRPDDEAQLQWVTSLLMKRAGRSGDMSLIEQVRRIEADVEAVRYRAEEVVGACSVEPLPADFATASARASQILAALPVTPEVALVPAAPANSSTRPTT